MCITNTNNTNTYLKVYMKYIHSFFATLKPDPPCYSYTIVRPPVALKCVTVKQTEGALWEVICMPELFSTLRSLRSCLHSRITASAAHTCNSCSAPAVSTRPSSAPVVPSCRVLSGTLNTIVYHPLKYPSLPLVVTKLGS